MFIMDKLFSVSILLVFEWSCYLDINVVSLLLGQFSELGIEGWQVKSGDLLIELLWKLVNLSVFIFVGISVLPKVDLSESLIGE